MPACARAAPATAPARPDPASPAYRSARSPDDGGCRSRGRAGSSPLRGSASETEPAETARPAPPARTGRGPTARATNGSASHSPAQDTTRNSPMTVNSRARCGQLRSHAIAYFARCKACASCSRETASGLRAGSDGSGVAPLNKLSGLPTQHPSTTAAVRHPFRSGNPHPEIRITRRRDCGAATP